MAEQQQTEILPPLAGPSSGVEMPRPSAGGPVGRAASNFFGQIITAQPCPVERDLAKIRQKMATLAKMNGEYYIYSWPVKDRKNRREKLIEGPTIKLANDLARTYGNCDVDVRVYAETKDFWIFIARFVDIETGFSMTRNFQQRKGQTSIDTDDQARRLDMAFQIGQSKAIRNVIVNALQSEVIYVMEEAKKRLLAWVENNTGKAQERIDQWLEKHDIALKSVEAVVGRVRKNWTIRDTAQVLAELRGIDEGLTVAEEVYPSEQDAGDVMREKEADRADKQPKPKADGAAEGDEKKADTKKTAGTKKTAAKKTAKKAAAKQAEPNLELGDEGDGDQGDDDDGGLPDPEPQPEPEESGEPEGDDSDAGGEEQGEDEGLNFE